MTDRDFVLTAVRQANPRAAGSPGRDGEWSTAELLSQIEQRSQTMDTLERQTDIPGPPDQSNRRRRLLVAAAAAVAVIVAIGVAIALSGGDDENPPVLNTTTTVAATTSTTATTVPEPVGVETSYELFAEQPVACGAEQPPAPANLTFGAPEDQAIPQDATVTAVVTTSCGDITIRLDQVAAPENVNSFVFLAREGFYDGSPIHRILPDLAIHAGDPTGTGLGFPGYELEDEIPEAGCLFRECPIFEPGEVLMSTRWIPLYDRPQGPRPAVQGGSQFFIVLEDNTWDISFGAAFTRLGRVVDSEETLALIRGVPLDFNTFDEQPDFDTGGWRRVATVPQESIYIESVTITIG